MLKTNLVIIKRVVNISKAVKLAIDLSKTSLIFIISYFNFVY